MLLRSLALLLLAAQAPAASSAFAADATPPAAGPVPAAPAAAPAAQVEAAAPSWAVSGSATEEYRFRASVGPDESDHWGRLALDFEATSPQELFAARASAGLWLRFNSVPPVGEPYGLASPRTDNPWLDVYTLCADWRPDGVFQRLRAGRQETEFGRPATFDGLSALIRLSPTVRAFAFGGRTVHFFEIDQGVFEDWMGSAGLELRGRSYKLQLDYRFLREDVPASLEDPAEKIRVTDHSYGVAGWLRAGDWLNARAQVRGLDDRVALVGAAVRAEWVEQQLGLDARIDVQPVELGELDELDDPYFLVLGPSKPHYQVHVDLFKGFSGRAGRYAVHLGGDARQLIDAEESPFNRNLLRAYLLVSAERIGGTGLFASAIGELDRVPDGRGTGAVCGAVGFDHRLFRGEVGSSYQRYKYRYYQSPEEIADVRELYGDVRVRVARWLAVRARYSYEVFDRRLHTVTLTLTQAY